MSSVVEAVAVVNVRGPLNLVAVDVVDVVVDDASLFGVEHIFYRPEPAITHPFVPPEGSEIALILMSHLIP